MDNYILLKDFPDVTKGTKLIWDKNTNSFYYYKDVWVSPHHQINYLTKEQVTENHEWFIKEQDCEEVFCFKNPTYSRKEILDLIEYCFPNKSISGQFEISASKQIRDFKEKLREIGKLKAKQIMTEKKYTIDDLRYCFEQSRLTHPMVGFKHDTFENFITKIDEQK